MESAYGLAITATMLTTTMLLSVYLWKIREKKAAALMVLVIFGAIEAVFFFSSLGKFSHGGYVAVIIALLLFAIMLIWLRGTKLEKRYRVRLKMADYIPNLHELHDDKTIPLSAENIVFLESERDDSVVDRDILYSILDKDPKRAAAYWFISISVEERPHVMRYKVETYGTDFIFRVRIYLGFKDHQRINVYLRQIVQDLIASGELPPQERKFSIYGNSNVGSFKFFYLRRVVPTKSALSQLDEIVLRCKYAIRFAAGSALQWYGLDTSSYSIEYVPLIVPSGQQKNARLERES